MEKALKMGKDSASGGFWLLVGRISSTVILAFSTIIIGLFIGVDEYGLYTIVLIPVATILLFQDWGIGAALTKYCAQYRNMKDQNSLRQLIKVGLTFTFATGIILTLISLSLANIIASSVFGKPEASFFIILVSFTIISTAIISGSQSIFLGFEKMKLISISVISQSVVQSGLSLFLVYSGYGTLGLLLGYIVGSIIGAIFSLFFLYTKIFRKLISKTSSGIESPISLKLLLKYGVPLGIGGLVSGLVLQFHSFMMASFLDETVIGNYKMALNFAGLLGFFTIPISRVLFPAFAKINWHEEPKLIKTIFNSSIKYTSLVLVPMTLAMMVLSQPIINTLYGDKWLYAPFFLSLVVILNLYVLFGTITIPNFLSAQGETVFLLKLNLLNLAIGIPLAIILIPNFGIPGLIVADILDYIPSIIIIVYWVGKKYNTKVNFRTSGKIFLASVVATIPTFLYVTYFAAPAWILLLSGAILFLVIYILITPLFGVIDEKDLDNLKTMFSGLGIISKILNILLLLMKKIIRLY